MFTGLGDWLARHLLGSGAPCPVRTPPRRAPLRLEPLESRQLLSVTLVPDLNNPGGGLRYLAASRDLNDVAEAIEGNPNLTNAAQNARAFDVIPRFSQAYPSLPASERFVAVASGDWSAGSTWNQAGRIPGPNSVVTIPSGRQVTFSADAAAKIVEVGDESGGLGSLSYVRPTTLPADRAVTFTVETLTVLPGGLLSISNDGAAPLADEVQAELVFADNNWDLNVDPQQFGHGLLAFGDLQLRGQSRVKTWTAVTEEVFADDRTIWLDEIPAGYQPDDYVAQIFSEWERGDEVVIADTRAYTLTPALDRQPFWHDPQHPAGSPWSSQTEVRTIDSVSWAWHPYSGRAHGVLRLQTPLQFDHRGIRSTLDPSVELLPHVGLLDSNVTLRSANPQYVPEAIRATDPTGISHRGHVLIGGRGAVSISGVHFDQLGRTDAVLRDYYRPDGMVEDAVDPATRQEQSLYEYLDEGDGTLRELELRHGAYSGRSHDELTSPVRALNNVRVATRVALDSSTGVPTAASLTRVDRAGNALASGQVHSEFRGTYVTPGGPVVNFEINQIGRYAVHFHHFVGPSRTATYSGSQFMFVGNLVTHSLKWGLALHDTSFGNVSGNVFFDTQAAAIMGESGAEVDNTIYRNLIVESRGGVAEGSAGGAVPDLAQEDVGREGTGIWMRRTGNLINNNVVADAAFAAYMFDGYYREGSARTDRPWLPRVVPGSSHRYRGVDPAEALSQTGTPSGERTLLRQQVWDPAQTLPQPSITRFEQLKNNPSGTFNSNVAYGMADRAIWAVLMSGPATNDPALLARINNFSVWNIWRSAIYIYTNTSVAFNNLQIINDPRPIAGQPGSGWTFPTGGQPLGVYFGDQYASSNAVILKGGILEGMGIGFHAPWAGDNSTQEAGTWKPVLNTADATLGPYIVNGLTIRDTKFKNYTNVLVRPLRDQQLGSMNLWLDNVKFYEGEFSGEGAPTAAYPTYPGQTPLPGATPRYELGQRHIYMQPAIPSRDNHTKNIQVFVTNYQAFNAAGASTVPAGQPRDFQVFFWEQDPKMNINATPAPSTPLADMPRTTSAALGAIFQLNQYVGYSNEAANPLSAAQIWRYYRLAPMGQWAPMAGSPQRLPDAVYAGPGVDWKAKILGIRATFPGLGVGYGGTGVWPTIAPADRLAIVTPWGGARIDSQNPVVILRYQLHGGLAANERIAYQIDSGPALPWISKITFSGLGFHRLRMVIQKLSGAGAWEDVAGTAKQVIVLVL